MRRLAIIDVDHGSQPVFDESGQVAAVFNGEIYNFQDLRADLIRKGHRLASQSDSECIPHLYEEYGEDFVVRLRGMFAIALWDDNLGCLFLYRDRLGKKPLYYREDAAGLAFASELKGLLADPATDRAIDHQAVSDYLTYQYVPAPRSAFAAVRKLEPGHMLRFDSEGATTRRYWELTFADAGSSITTPTRELAEELRHRLLDCVQVRLTSERPLGAFLSGGLDSSAIVAAMSRLAPGRVKTFSIGFDEESHNELPFARQVAELYDTDHHELVVRPVLMDVLPQLASSFDEPYADSSAIPSFYLAQMAREHVVVALNGDGGDEALGGYLRYARFMQTPQRRLPPGVSRLLLSAGTTLGPYGKRWPAIRKASTAATLLAERDPALRYARFMSYFRPEEKRHLLSDSFLDAANEDSYDLIRDLWRRHQHTDGLNRLLAVDTHSYLPGDLLPKVDITTMSVSLEARSPLLDHTFMEWAASLPGDLKLRGGQTKYLFKQALAPWLPQELIHRRKMGFGIPLAGWLRGPLREMTYDLLTDSTCQARGWYREGAIATLLAEHMEGQDRSARIYALLMLELWLREVACSTRSTT